MKSQHPCCRCAERFPFYPTPNEDFEPEFAWIPTRVEGKFIWWQPYEEKLLGWQWRGFEFGFQPVLERRRVG